MSQSIVFHQSGSIAGIPGDFANCIVDIADDGTQTVTPLAMHPAFAPEIPLETPQDEAATSTEEVAQEVRPASKTKGA